MKLLAVALAVIVLSQAVGAAVAVEAVRETCETDGLAYDCVTEQVVTTEMRIGYDNGLPGTVNATNSTRPHEEWPASLDGFPVPPGVSLGAFHETPVRLFGAFNGTLQPDIHAVRVSRYDGARDSGIWAARVLQFPFRLAPEDVMNGASRYYYRSPIKWNPQNYTDHYVEIRKDAYVVAAAGKNEINDQNFPQNTTRRVTIVGDRLYYHMNAMLESGVNYTLTEYVLTRGTPPLGLAHVDVYAALYQDIDRDGRKELRLFPGHASERSYSDMEPAYSFRFVYGMGAGGAVNLVKAVPGRDHVTIEAKNIPVKNKTADANQARLVIPIRTTVPLEIDLHVTAPCGASNKILRGVTSSVVETIGICTPDANDTLRDYYEVRLRVNLNSSLVCGGEECNYLSYPMVPAHKDGAPENSVHAVQYERDGVARDTIVYEWAPWIEVYEAYKPPEVPPPPAQESTRTRDFLLGVGTILFGVLPLLVYSIVADVDIPLSVLVASAIPGLNVVVGAHLIGSAIVGRDGVAALRSDLAPALARAAQLAAGVAAVAACAGAFIAPHPLAKVGLGATCALLGIAALGGLPSLLDFVLRLPTIIKAAVEKIGQFFQNILNTLAPWAKLAYSIAVALTIVFLTREAILWFLNLLRPFTRDGNRAVRSYIDTVDRTVAEMSVPIWDGVLYKAGAKRGRYAREAKA